MAEAALAPIGRRSVVDEIYERLSTRILSGEMPAGEALPAEQELAEALGVSRPAVREALNRLAAARLVSMRHSGGKRVLDFRRSAGLELLPALLVTADDRIDAGVVRSVMEMRSAIGPDVARLAARRRERPLAPKLRALVRKMEETAEDLAALHEATEEFWSHLVDASGNIAYRLAFNSLRASYDKVRSLVTQVLAVELADVQGYAAIADAVASGDGPRAETLARRLLERGEQSINEMLGGQEPGARRKRK